MLNKYLDLLHQATDAMTNVGHSGAGASEYFQAVGYEFLVIGLGLLYFAAIAVVCIGPILYVYFGVKKKGLASKQYKAYLGIIAEMIKFDHECNTMIERFFIGTVDNRIDRFEQIAAKISKYCTKFSEDKWYDNVPGEDRDEKIKYLTEKIDSDKFPGSALRKLFPLYHFCSFSELSEYTEAAGIDLDVFTERIRDIFPDSAALNEEIKRFKAKCIFASILFFTVYTMLVLPLVLLLF